MKKFIVLLLASLWLVPGIASAQSVTIGAIPSSLCAGDALSVNFTATGFFGHKNAFTLQLSDINGSFSSFANLASITDTLPGTFTITTVVPSGNSKHYRFRILAAVPYMTSADNGSDIAISTMPDVGVTYTTPGGYSGPQSIVVAGVQAQFTLSQGYGDSPVVDSVFWDFGPDATPQTAAGMLSENVTYATGGRKIGSVRIVVGGCGSRTISFPLLVLGCTPQIPKYAIVVDSSFKPYDPIGGRTYWVNPGKTLDISGSQHDTVFAEPGTVIKDGVMSLLYLKAGSAYSPGLGSIIFYSKGSSVGPSADNFGISCDNLTFDYTTAPPNAAHPLSVKNDLAALPIRISPNPTTGIITVEGAPMDNLNVSVMNILGETAMELLNINSSNFTIDLSKLARGTYYIRFASSNSVMTKKVVKE